MKFAFVISSLKGGGAQKAILKTASILTRAGHECIIYLLSSENDYSLLNGIRVQVISLPFLKGSGWLSKRILAILLRLHLKKSNANMVVSTLPFSDEVTFLANVPNHWCRIANTLSVEVEKLATKDRRKSNRRFERYKLIYENRKLIAVSKGVAEDLAKYFKIQNKIDVVYNPFNEDYINNLASEKLEKYIKPYIVYVGRFSSQKRFDLLLDAFSRVPSQYDLVMLTKENIELKEMIEARGLKNRVKVIGFQKNPYFWMRNAKLLILTSDQEGLPNVLIESLICGTPVVSTDCPSGPREILLDTSPESLVPCGDLDALSKCINEKLVKEDITVKFDSAKFSENNLLAAYERLAKGL